ncbi:flagellar hook-associated 2-like protein [Paraglaciecola sp. T6c]|uniref:flagellar filament capping protein FliD n=1 Tax=Pseudoalteromonas atlantica (strain T6c / ATCC BAA-1087) TaxID=3042615 RepID=UPI00005C6EC5|nr:flagellar filament capping protein FliD [Paraglaciecola sp. T6c]ABG41589.1 flagellar hook-associated 2-like protein [Paraglaciecola sp. T6c]
MSIQSLGVGSGLDLEALVSQLLEAERTPKQARLDSQEESYDAEISSIGTLKSKMKEFLDSVDELRSDANLKGREPTIKNPSENIEPFTAEASNSAVEADYAIAVTQLANGSRIETDNAVDGGFSSTSDSVSAQAGSLTFKIGATTDTFSINVTAGMTLQQLSSAINSSDDNFGVRSSIIDTGTASGGAKLVFTSSVQGEGNDLMIVNDNNIADLNRVATTDSTETAAYLDPVKSAQNSKATIDGIAVESSTTEFENVIENVSFTVSQLSELDEDGITPKTSNLKIGFDAEGLEGKIRDFVDNFNALNTQITTLTRYGASDLEEDGALAGDSMIRGIQQGLSNMISANVSSSGLGTLFQLGIEFNEDGDLEIGSSDKFGFGSGEDRLKDALEDSFDDIAALFADSENGVAVRMHDYIEQYTNYSGLLTSREKSVQDQKDQLADEREQFELRMASTEQILRDKYLNLDQTVAQLNQTGSALLASLGSA